MEVEEGHALPGTAKAEFCTLESDPAREKPGSIELETVLSEVLAILDNPSTRALCADTRASGDIVTARYLVKWVSEYMQTRRELAMSKVAPPRRLPPPSLPVVNRPRFCLDARGRITELAASELIPTSAKYWCYPRASVWTPNPNFTPMAPKLREWAYKPEAGRPAWDIGDEDIPKTST